MQELTVLPARTRQSPGVRAGTYPAGRVSCTADRYVLNTAKPVTAEHSNY